MSFLIATTTATSTLYALTDEAMDLINFFSQLSLWLGCLIIGCLVILITIEIFK